jgi:hypothetical protein
MGFIAHRVPDYLDPDDYGNDPQRLAALPERFSLPSFRELVQATFGYRERHPATYAERVIGFKAAMDTDIQHVDEIKRNAAHFTVDWMKRFLRVDRVLRRYDPNVAVDDLLKRVEIDRCPAVKLWFLARYKRVRAGHPAKDNDADDWGSLPVVPYSDLMLTEKPLREFIIQADRALAGKVTADPSEAVQLLARWM